MNFSLIIQKIYNKTKSWKAKHLDMFMGEALVDQRQQKCTKQWEIFVVFNMHYYDSEWDAIQGCDSKRDAS